MEITLIQAISKDAGAQAPALLKHLAESGIGDWGDLTKSRLYDFRDMLTGEVAASSARTYFAAFKSILARYVDEVAIPKDYGEILRARNEKPVKTWLTPAELKRLEGVEAHGDTERQVLYQFLIGAYTGMRISDIRNVTDENIMDGQLTYVSEKASVKSTVPCGGRIRGYILWVQEHERAISLAGYNKAIRRLCRRAGITGRVKVFRAGRTEAGEKWRYVSSHTARISFCTNLAGLGVPLLDISRMAGHTGTSMTERYIVNEKVALPKAAREYFR